MESIEKALIHWMSIKSKNPEYDFRIYKREDSLGNPDEFVVLYVDCPKMDKNSGSYDENYRKSLVPDRPKRSAGGIIFPAKYDAKFEHILGDAEQFFKIKKHYYFAFQLKNYEYLDKIEKEMKDLIMEEYGGTCDFGFDSDSPIVELTFKDIGYDSESNYNDTKEELEKLVSTIGYTLESYNVRLQYGKKKNTID